MRRKVKKSFMHRSMLRSQAVQNGMARKKGEDKSLASKLILLLVLSILAYIDHKTKKVYNILVLPLTAIGMILTSNYFWPFAMLALLMAIVYDDEFNHDGFLNWQGGDIKLFMMISAFLGIWSFMILALTILAEKFIRNGLRYYKGFALTPLVFLVTLISTIFI